MQFVFCILFFKQFDAFEKVFSKCFKKFDVYNAQNNVFYFESDIAKVFPFRPTCSSYDSERKKSQKVNQKRTRKESEQMWQTWIRSIRGNLRRFFVIFIWNYHYSAQLNRTKGRN